MLHIGLHLSHSIRNICFVFFFFRYPQMSDLNVHSCIFSATYSLNLNTHKGHLLQLSHLIANKNMLLVRILSSVFWICLESVHRHFHTFYYMSC